MSKRRRESGHRKSQPEACVAGNTGKPLINPHRIRPEDHSWLLEVNREQKYADKACMYCSDRREIRHHHFSSTRQRYFMLKHTKSGWMCPVCQKVENDTAKTAARRVLIADSTVFGIWDQKDLPKISDHMDIECIVDARIRHLSRALRKNILDSENSLQIIVVGGIANVGDGQTAREIMEEFKEMEDLVVEYRKRSSITAGSWISFSTLPLPPKYCTFNVPKNVPELANWVPGPSFKNYYPIIKEVNEALKAMNERNSLSWLNIHLQGMKILKSGPQHKYDTRPESLKVWRETNVFDKLHFTMANKLKLITYMQKTFTVNEQKHGQGPTRSTT